MVLACFVALFFFVRFSVVRLSVVRFFVALISIVVFPFSGYQAFFARKSIATSNRKRCPPPLRTSKL